MSTLRSALLLSAAFSTILAAASSAGAPQGGQVGFNADVQPIFDHYCVACHRTDGPAGGIALERGYAYQQIVGVPSNQTQMNLVSSRDPERSYLLRKMENTHLGAGGTGYPMPAFAGNPATTEAVATVRRWIAQGAEEK